MDGKRGRGSVKWGLRGDFPIVQVLCNLLYRKDTMASSEVRSSRMVSKREMGILDYLLSLKNMDVIISTTLRNALSESKQAIL
jgi:hypothetical protein